jgi:hypothetical protein
MFDEERPSTAAEYQQQLVRNAHHEIANERFPAEEQEEEPQEQEES